MFSAQHIHALLCLLIGWPMNLLLIWLILFKTNKSMRVWSWLLLQTSLIDLANLLVFFIVQPILFFNGNLVAFYSEGPFGQCRQEIIFLLCTFCIYFFELSKYAISGQFFYRWMIICREQKFTPTLYAAIIIIPIFIAFLPIFDTFLVMDFSLPQQTTTTCPKCPADKTVLFSKSNTSNVFYFTISMITLTNSTAYSIILATSIQIWRKSRQTLLADQQHSREFSRQIGRVLLIQALFPLFLSLFPTFLITFFIVLRLDMPEIVTMIAFQPWPSVLTPLITVLIIGQYRRFLAKFLCKNAQSNRIIPPINTTIGLVDSN